MYHFCSETRHRSIRIGVSCTILLVLISLLALPIYADDPEEQALPETHEVLIVNISDVESVPPIEEPAQVEIEKPVEAASAQTLVASAHIGSVLPDFKSPVARKSGSSALPLGLAAAGLLMIPFDNSVVDSLPRTPARDKSDGVTEAVNMLGDKTTLLAAVAGMYLLGDSYDKETAKIALTALAGTAMVTEGIKKTTGRARPSVVGEAGEFTGPSFTPGYSSFPSGHTSAAFAMATVLANRHPDQKWVYYGLATAVGLARVRKSAHFPSDVLVGAGLGMYVGDRAVNGGSGLFSIRF